MQLTCVPLWVPNTSTHFSSSKTKDGVALIIGHHFVFACSSFIKLPLAISAPFRPVAVLREGRIDLDAAQCLRPNVAVRVQEVVRDAVLGTDG